MRAQRETQSPGWGLLAQRLLLPQDRSSLACAHTADTFPRIRQVTLPCYSSTHQSHRTNFH